MARTDGTYFTKIYIFFLFPLASVVLCRAGAIGRPVCRAVLWAAVMSKLENILFQYREKMWHAGGHDEQFSATCVCV